MIWLIVVFMAFIVLSVAIGGISIYYAWADMRTRACDGEYSEHDYDPRLGPV